MGLAETSVRNMQEKASFPEGTGVGSGGGGGGGKLKMKPSCPP